jgi:RimJ/RimL family protein N-acetyltransferase
MHIDTALLKGQHVYLEALLEEHVPFLRVLARDERIWEYTRTILLDETFNEQFDRYMRIALDPAAFGGQQSFVIRQTGDDRIIGSTRMYFMEPKEKRLTIGYTWYTPDVWGKMHNPECKLLMLQYVFEVLQFNRVEFQVAHQNIRSQKAMEKIGAVKEGVLRKHGYRADGSVRDTVVFSIINDEWPLKKEKLRQMVQTAETP